MKIKKVIKIILLAIVLAAYFGLLFICENKLIAWMTLGVSILVGIYLSRILKEKHKKRVLLIIAVMVVNVVVFYNSCVISVRGALLSKVMVPVMAPQFAEEMLQSKEKSLENNQKNAKEAWNKDGYILKKYTEGKVKFETISKEKGKDDKVIMLIHGGAFVVGLKNSYRDLAVKFSDRSKGALIVLADYTTSEVAPYPAALNDCLATYEWIIKQGYDPKNIIVTGDSAGGNLALALGLYLRDRKKELPAGILTISAFANMKFNSKSYYENANHCVLGNWFGNGKIDPRKFYYTEDKKINLEDPYVSPVYGDYKGFPKLLMQVGSREIVLDDTKTIVANAKQAGVDAKASIYHGMWHVFQVIGLEFPESVAAWNEIESFITDVFNY